LIKNGAGTLTLTNNNNTFSGGLTLNGGTLAVASEASLGAPENVLTLNAGRLEFTQDGTITRTYTLNNATTIAPAPGRTLSYLAGSAVNGGTLGAGGTHEFASGFVLNGSTAAVGSRLTTNGNVTFTNATLRGAVTQNSGTLAMTNTVISTAGSLAVNGTTTTNGVESTGVIRVNAGGVIASSGAPLVLGGGSRTTIAAGGTLAAAPAMSIELNSGMLTNDGTQTGTLNVNFGSVAQGNGSWGNVHVNEGGRFSAGAGPAVVNLAALTLGSGGHYTFELASTSAVAGVGADFLNIAGQLQIAAGTTADTRFTIALVSVSGSAFDPTQPWTFTLATAAGGISGFSADRFAIDSSGFGVALNGGSFVVSQSGNDLLLQFAPIPEPSTWAIMLVGIGLLIAARRRQR
jgi:autotransporter-associated beta strand protein